VSENGTSLGQSYIRSGMIKCGVGDYTTTKLAIANLDTLCKHKLNMKTMWIMEFKCYMSL